MAFNNRGVSLKNMGQYAKAIADYDVAIRLDASKSNRWNNRCWARLLLGQLQPRCPIATKR